MFHENRRYSVVSIATADELAHKLTQYTWCTCNGFRLGDLLFLNDSTGPDGAQEFAVFRNGRKIESITFSWCTEAEALKHIQDLANGGGGDYGPMKVGAVETPNQHGTCPRCA